jgi:hypothetical protein
MSSVSSYYPARDEILLIDNETRQIIAPAGYNNIVCNCGDVGVASVYFLINRYLGKKRELDVSKATISIYVRTSEATVTFTENITKRLYTEEISDRNQEGLVLIEWKIPNEISDSWSLTAGFEIALRFFENDKAWNSNSYTQLKVGDSIYGGEVSKLAGDSNIVYQFMEQYFNDYNVVFSANDEDDE